MLGVAPPDGKLDGNCEMAVCPACLDSINSVFQAILAFHRRIEGERAMSAYIRGTVWPHVEEHKQHLMRAVLYRAPFRIRTPEALDDQAYLVLEQVLLPACCLPVACCCLLGAASSCCLPAYCCWLVLSVVVCLYWLTLTIPTPPDHVYQIFGCINVELEKRKHPLLSESDRASFTVFAMARCSGAETPSAAVSAASMFGFGGMALALPVPGRR